MSFSEGLLFIGNRAFYNCSLASLAIPDSTISIGEEAFLSVDPLTEVYLGSGLSELGAMAFKECYRLEKITVSDDNSSFKSIDGVLYTKDGKTLLYFPQAKSGTGFFIPEEVVTIGDYAFYKATGIIELEIPASVEIIGESAFREAASLKKVQISGAREIRDYAFYDCENITVLTMKEGTVSIGNQAFAELGSLTVVLIPDSVTHLGDGAFMFLYNLRILKIGEGITEIPYAAFAYCTSISAVDLHEGVKIIGDRAFDSCYEMRSINLSNVTSIGKNAFYSCHKLGSVDLRNAVTIGEWAFHDCSNITSAVLGRELESIGAGAFNCFEYLKKIYYCGTADQWELLTIGDDNSPLHYPTRRYYYSESEPAEYGRFWHYDESGNVVVW